MVVRRKANKTPAFPGTLQRSWDGLQVIEWDRLPPAPAGDSAHEALVLQLPSADPKGLRSYLRRWRSDPGGPVLTFSLTRHGQAEKESIALKIGTHIRCPFPLTGLRELLLRERDLLLMQNHWKQIRGLLREEQQRMHIMRDISAAANSHLDPDKVIGSVMEKARRILPCEAWSLFLLDESRNRLFIRTSSSSRKDPRMAVSEAIPQWVVRRREPLLVTCREGKIREFPLRNGSVGEKVRSVLCLPLRSRSRIIGALQLVNRPRGEVFTPADRDFLFGLLEPASIAIENALLFRKAEALSVTDDLTRLYNARYLNHMLHREVERSRRYGFQVSLIFLDLDGFKEVNDQYGHLAGSRALVEVGAVLKGTVRSIDVVSRFGGDEFTVVLPQTGVQGAATIAERIRSQLQKEVFLEDLGLEVRITASFGVATFPDHGSDKDDLIAQADRAMYSVKGNRKNAVAVAA
ncbi:MAG: sensor domain-containing diguanylate cyclase [Acidobacteriota bacterium]